MSYSKRSIFSALTALLALGPALVYAKPEQPADTDGPYKVTVAGDYSGTGTATVDNKKVSITVEVTDGAGNKGQFTAKLDLKGPHFSGEGKAIGQTVTITGRLDGYAQPKPGKGKGRGNQGKGKDFTGSRLLGSYSGGGKTGRIAGAKPAGTPSN